MKTLFHCLCPLLFVSVLLGQESSTIKTVTVYLDGAEVNREASIHLKSGTSELVFNNLSPYIEESSIQISGLKSASILSVNYGINYLSKQKRNDSIVRLQKSLKVIDESIQEQEHLISGYNEEISLIQSNKRLGNETQVVSLEQLQAFATYYRERITELKSNISGSNRTIDDYESQKSALIKQLNGFNSDEKVQTGEIKLKLNTAEPQKLDLNLSYTIKNAGWFPIYDLKADQINSPINLEYKAHVYQRSGCDWTDVKLILSTADPNTNNEKPTVNPKYLNFISPYQSYQSQRATKHYNYKYNPLVKHVSGVVTTASDGLPLPGVTIIEKGTTNGVQTDFDGRYSLRTTTGNTLVYTFLGMQSEELPIHSSIMNVALDEDPIQLSEVAIVGYGGSKKTSNEDVAKYLKGQLGGVSNIKIRGAASANGSQPPLYIVDGKPVSADVLSSLSSDAVASMKVLKNQEATALYGSRGKHGVIVIKLKSEDQMKTNALGVSIDTGITNTRFEIDKTYSIPSDGDVTVIEIDKFSIPANYNYFAAPVLNENVFLTAKIGNWEQYNLLPAEANIYFEGSYSGKTNINPGATTDSLTISLGVDPNITVKRTQRNDFKKTTFIGSNKVVYKAYDIDIRNNKTAPVQLTVVDRIPITQNRAIKIDDIDTGTSNYDEEKGLLEWVLDLQPGERAKVVHAYTIKFPKGKQVNL